MIHNDLTKSSHRKSRYHVPIFVRWRVPGYNGKDLRVFAMYSLGFRKDQIHSVELLREFKRTFRRIASRLNKHKLLYEKGRVRKEFLTACRDSYIKGDHMILYKYQDSLLPKPPPLEEVDAGSPGGYVPRYARTTGPVPYWEPLNPIPYGLRGHRAAVMSDETHSAQGTFDPERIAGLKVNGVFTNLPLEGFDLAYAMSMIEHTRSGFFDEETLDIFFEDLVTEINDWSQVPADREYRITYWYKDDAWYIDRNARGALCTIKVPKCPILPGYGTRLRQHLEKLLDNDP